MTRQAVEADIPWMVESAREKHAWTGLGEFDPNYVARVIRGSVSHVKNKSLLVGVECPVAVSGEDAVNQVIFWDSDGSAWALLKAHEASSPLPSMISVPANHDRHDALVRALRMRGYRHLETQMVK
jgi:hypothetical protein